MANPKIINSVLKSIDGGTLIQKFIEDINRHKRQFSKTENFQTISVGVSIFLNNELIRSHHFGKKGSSVPNVIKSIQKGDILNKSQDNIFRSLFCPEAGEDPGGAIRSNGITISCSGLKSNTKNEYFAWLILNTIERRVNEFGGKFTDTRYRNIDNNSYIKEEKERWTVLNCIPKHEEK